MNNNITWLIIDWGTTNFRAFGMSSDNGIIDKIERSIGLIKVDKNDFCQVLENILAKWLGPIEYQELPIYMAGMVGSAQGWIEVPYIQTPATTQSLSRNLYKFKLPWGADAAIVPGVCTTDDSCFDVMRGEEVQAIGLKKLVQEEYIQAIFPGTHSKHIYCKGEELSKFTTFMTGEIFSILNKYSLLGRDLPQQIDSPSAFVRGVMEGKDSIILSKLFTVRTYRLFNIIEEREVNEYMSGILIGYEVNKFIGKKLYLVGDVSLCEKYKQACELLQIKSEYINGENAFIKGMLEIKGYLAND